MIEHNMVRDDADFESYKNYDFARLAEGGEIEINTLKGEEFPLTFIRRVNNILEVEVIKQLSFSDNWFETFSTHKFVETLPIAVQRLKEEGESYFVIGGGAVEDEYLVVNWSLMFPLDTKQEILKTSIERSIDTILNKTLDILNNKLPGAIFMGNKKLS